MPRIELPISKSIANRLLILQAIHGDGLMTVSADLPADVQLLHRALTTLHNPTQPYTTPHNTPQAAPHSTSYPPLQIIAAMSLSVRHWSRRMVRRSLWCSQGARMSIRPSAQASNRFPPGFARSVKPFSCSTISG